jgi:N-acetylglucosaminyldiphosphoundecaprenol N-acetyl-beta-D-mannosaminyltransferase
MINLADKINILEVGITFCSYEDIIEYIKKQIIKEEKTIISYIAFHSLNILMKLKERNEILNTVDLLHADGLGIYLASVLLYGFSNNRRKITGSDFYSCFMVAAKINNWSFYFFGDNESTLQRIKNNINVVGYQSGYDYNTDYLINKINSVAPNFLVIGLGCPKQELWVLENQEKIKANIIICVGNGLKIFAGVRIRGPFWMQIIGMEWLYRIYKEPKRLWKRYLIGIPVFIFKVIQFKFKLMLKNENT